MNRNQHPIKSYVIRQSRMSPLQKRALDELSDKYGIPFQEKPYNFQDSFPRQNPVIAEIGFGMGAATVELAQNRNQFNYLGIEVHPPGVGKLLSEIERLCLDNVLIIRHDAVEVLEKMVLPGTFTGVHIFFPDPWPKKKHHKRRLIRPDFITLLSSRLMDSGYLYIVTDWADYSDHIRAVMKDVPAFRLEEEPDWRPVTAFEKKGIAKGHAIHSFLFRKVQVM